MNIIIITNQLKLLHICIKNYIYRYQIIFYWVITQLLPLI
jgi:hypothetical protein